MKKTICLLLLSVFLLFSCSKDEQFFQNENSPISYRESLTIPEHDHTFDKHPDTLIQTALGEELNNPFTVTNLQRALLSLCDDPENSRIQIRTTDRQIKFTPDDYDEVKRLFRDTSLILFDYPLNREVITMGDYYIDTNKGEDFPAFYSIVEIDKPLPEGISYEVVEEYDYEIENPLLIAESFRLTDNFEYVNDYIFPEDIEDEIEICGKVIIVPPDDIDCPPPCIPKLVIDDSQTGTGGRPVYIWECDCSDSGGGSGGGGLNACGCPDDGEQRTPAGCITVENTTISGPEGVRKVRVILKNYRFGKPYKTWTDDDGCWQYTSKKFKGRMWMWVEFKNEFSFERCYVPGWEIIFGATGVVIEYLKPVRHSIGSMWGPNFSDIEIHYPHWATLGSQEQILWGAATVNNEVQVFNDTTDVNDLPGNLDIYMMPHLGSGAALMSSYGTLNALFGMSATVLAPDLMLGLNVFDRGVQDLLSYHEMGHASHFTKVGPVWWEALIAAETENSILNLQFWSFETDPYGDGNGLLDGYIAVAESWAENIARDFTGTGRERLVFWRSNYIPGGLYNDLEDSLNIDDISLGLVRDNVRDFTRGQLFNALTFSVNSIEDYRERLRSELPSGNIMMDYDTLFADYIP